MSKESLRAHLREIPDFPVPGILFYDVTTLFKDPVCLKEMVDMLYEHYKDKGITKVVGIESRGYVLGPALAIRLGAGFVMARKPGKLPAEKISEFYNKEYGVDMIEMHCDSITPDDVVLLHDDLLATGGTLSAACRLVGNFSPKKIYMGCIIDIYDLPRVKEFPADVELFSLLQLSEEGDKKALGFK